MGSPHEGRACRRLYAFGGASIDLRPRGALEFRWPEHGVFRGVVEEVDPPHRFSFRLAQAPNAAPQAGNATVIEFSLVADGEVTRVRVVERGFSQLRLTEGERESLLVRNSEAWTVSLDGLRVRAEERSPSERSPGA